MKTAIQIVLVILIFVLGFLVIDSIMRPIRFQRLVDEREEAVKTRLFDIREAEKAYKDVYKTYMGSFDTLKMFLVNDSFTVTKAIGTIPEEWLEEFGLEQAKLKAISEGVIVRETSRVNVLDSLFGADYPVDSLSYIPYTEGAEFGIAADVLLTSSNLVIQVVEVTADFDIFLKGLNEQLIVNYIDQKIPIMGYPGMKFGSLEEGSLSGNWE